MKAMQKKTRKTNFRTLATSEKASLTRFRCLRWFFTGGTAEKISLNLYFEYKPVELGVNILPGKILINLAKSSRVHDDANKHFRTFIPKARPLRGLRQRDAFYGRGDTTQIPRGHHHPEPNAVASGRQ